MEVAALELGSTRTSHRIVERDGHPGGRARVDVETYSHAVSRLRRAFGRARDQGDSGPLLHGLMEQLQIQTLGFFAQDRGSTKFTKHAPLVFGGLLRARWHKLNFILGVCRQCAVTTSSLAGNSLLGINNPCGSIESATRPVYTGVLIFDSIENDWVLK